MLRRPLILPLGQYATLEADRPQGGGQDAGTISAAIPAETVQHNGRATPAQLKVQGSVYFQDVVRTLNTGRVRIRLMDGSLLNIGARSQMTIARYDAQSQPTAIELAAGKLRSQVQKLYRQGGSFEVTTQTAVIGVVGTHFIVEAEQRRTRVWCIEGEVRVRNINPAIAGFVLLHAGEFTIVPLGQLPGAATHVSPGVIQTLISLTDASVLAPGTRGKSNAVIAAVSVGAAATAGMAIGRANSATSLLDQAGSILNGATNTLNNANTNSTNA